ncbi:MAG TPA: hypothetical protein VIT20_07240 [Propionibacteriaceae bacterium]
MSRKVLAGLTLVLMGLVGCSGGEPDPADEGATTPGVETPTPTPTPEVVDCLSGSYRVVRFVGLTSQGGSGEGGDLTAVLGAGGFTLNGGGQSPVKVTVGSQQVDLVVTGSIRGTYTTTDAGGSYAVTGTEGEAKVSAGILHRTLPMTDVANVLTPDGTGTLTCAGTGVTMTSTSSRLDLERI